MNVLLVSQCHKNALKETRRILDQFAERYGTRTWRTCITAQGLETVKKLLKKTARKNTSVACHWLRSRNTTELLWIIGNPSCFNEQGITPTNATQHNVLKKGSENDWNTLESMKIMASIAALFHDVGKASHAFQEKLTSKKIIKDAYRHEWVSLQLFAHFVGDAHDDHTWLSKLSQCSEKDSVNKIELIVRPFKYLPPLAKIIGWLILSHHFLPVHSEKKSEHFELDTLDAAWNNQNKEASDKEQKMCLTFQHGTPFNSGSWCQRAHFYAEKALSHADIFKPDWLEDKYSLHISRLSVMLGDHYYSSRDKNEKLGDTGYKLFANTDKSGYLKQRLDEHLIGVEEQTKKILRTLPRLWQSLPKITRHKGFKARTKDEKFRWQDKAFDLACGLREKSQQQGFFGINMASTGCGKTLANGRIMYGLADPQLGARFSIALGLRTLTLQTGDVYKKRLSLKDEDLAIMIGSSAVKTLFELAQKEKIIGSESAEPLSEEGYVHYGDIEIEGSPFETWLQADKRGKKLLYAPILVSTIDHLIGATEGTKGGRQIIPMLRLMTADLILDEPDDFGMEDLPALTRLVNWAGMLGSRILLSSATLPPSMIEGLFQAYLEGRRSYQRARGVINQPVNIVCAWFDEKNAMSDDHATMDTFRIAHQHFVKKRIEMIKTSEVRRKAKMVNFSVTADKKTALFYVEAMKQLEVFAYQLHQLHHVIDHNTHKKVSFGLIRCANINPLAHIAKVWFEQKPSENTHIFLCCYHSQYPLLMRHHIEKMLDAFLTRHTEDTVFNDPMYQKLTRNIQAENILFIVLATPVAEVGRDHDYDWAIVEPSSMRSMIQLAGRVRRHREGECTQDNIYLLGTNIKSLEKKRVATYCNPGFEKGSKEDEHQHFLLNSHDLKDILSKEQYETINASPRILENSEPHPKDNLVDLEHYRLQALMLGGVEGETAVSRWWEREVHLSGQYQKDTQFRKSQETESFAYIVDEDYETLKFHHIEKDSHKETDKIKKIDCNPVQGIQAWGYEDYEGLLNAYAEEREQSLEDAAFEVGTVDLRKPKDDSPAEWCYNDLLGVFRE